MPDLDGFIDITPVLKLGIYVLIHQSRVVFIGKANLPLAKIWAHRDLSSRKSPDWLPIKGITYDKVLVRPAHPDRIDRELAALIAIHQPRHNVQSPAYLSSATQPMVRRI